MDYKERVRTILFSAGLGFSLDPEALFIPKPLVVVNKVRMTDTLLVVI